MKHLVFSIISLLWVATSSAQTYYVCTGETYDIHHAASTPTITYTKRTGKVTIGNLKYTPEEIDSIVFTRPEKLRLNTKRWMSTLPNTTPLRSLTIPGAHDAATKNCGSASQCQSLTITELLNAGVRALDLRPRYTGSSESDITLNNLEIYHGVSATGVLFKDAIADIVEFLRTNSSETVFINLQKESSGGTDYSSTWRSSIRTCLNNNSNYVLQKLTATLTLNSCRGKMVVISHNPYGSEGVYNDIVYGALTDGWGDDESFTTNLLHTYGSVVSAAHVTDNYNATNNTNKQNYLRANFDAASSSTTDYYISFMNVAWKWSSPFTYPFDYAKTHNSWLNGQLNAGTWTGRLGIIYQDFCGDSDCTPDLVTNIILHNHRTLWP